MIENIGKGKALDELEMDYILMLLILDQRVFMAIEVKEQFYHNIYIYI